MHSFLFLLLEQQWDDELELMSLTNAVQCKMAYDKCVRTANYKHAGQNIYEKCYSADKILHPNDIVTAGMHSWIDEFHNISDVSVEHFVNADVIAKIGRYLQVVKNNADRIGCSLVEYNNTDDSVLCALLVCNYNAGNVIGVPTYEVGPSASKCTTGTDSSFPGLCSKREDFTKHKYAEVFFKNESPIVVEWVKRHKKINVGGVQITYENDYDSIKIHSLLDFDNL